jgi:glycosyltransferase involved in cell wall biosynthesis
MFDISILMPSYNQGDYIRRAIDSVLSQRSCRVQLIIMDGGSTDQTLSVLKSYDSRITYRSEPDRGQSHALNKALDMASAPVIGWLNSDDMYLPGTFQHVLSCFKRNSQVALIHGDRILVDYKSKVVGFSVNGPFIPVSKRFNICSETAFWRAGCIPTHRFREDLRFAMDVHFLAFIAKSKPHLYLNKYLGCFRCHSGAKSSTLWEKVAVPEAREVWRSLFGQDIVLDLPTSVSKWNQIRNFLRLPLPYLISFTKSKISNQFRNL